MGLEEGRGWGAALSELAFSIDSIWLHNELLLWPPACTAIALTFLGAWGWHNPFPHLMCSTFVYLLLL